MIFELAKKKDLAKIKMRTDLLLDIVFLTNNFIAH